MSASSRNFSAPEGKSTGPTPPQFFTGESPLIADPPVIPIVPYLTKSGWAPPWRFR